MAEGKTNMFGKTYNTIGSTDSNFIIKTKGDLKVQWGNKYIDLIKNGKVASEYPKMLHIVSNYEEMKQNGIYIVTEKDNELWVCIDDTKVQIANTTGDNTYVSFLIDQTASSVEKHRALSNIGFYYKDLDEAATAKIESGIIYTEDDNKLYVVKDGKFIEYKVMHSTTELITSELVTKEPLYIEEYSLLADGAEYIKCQKNNIYLLELVEVHDILMSKDFSEVSGYRLYLKDDNKESVFDIDHINWKKYPVHITYEDLMLKMEEGKLTTKMFYMITNFLNPWEISWPDEPMYYEDLFLEVLEEEGAEPIKYLSGKRNAMELIVLAKSPDSLELQAWSPMNPEWVIEYDPTYKGLEYIVKEINSEGVEEDVKYYGNRIRKTEQINEETGETTITTSYLPCRGQITYLKDEFGNEANFNFRHLLFYHSDSNTWRYCFDVSNNAEKFGLFNAQASENKIIIDLLEIRNQVFKFTEVKDEENKFVRFDVDYLDYEEPINEGYIIDIFDGIISKNIFELNLNLEKVTEFPVVITIGVGNLKEFSENTFINIDKDIFIGKEAIKNTFENIQGEIFIDSKLEAFNENTFKDIESSIRLEIEGSSFKNNIFEGIKEFTNIQNNKTFENNTITLFEGLLSNNHEFMDNIINSSSIKILNEKSFNKNEILNTGGSIKNDFEGLFTENYFEHFSEGHIENTKTFSKNNITYYNNNITNRNLFLENIITKNTKIENNDLGIFEGNNILGEGEITNQNKFSKNILEEYNGVILNGFELCENNIVLFFGTIINGEEGLFNNNELTDCDIKIENNKTFTNNLITTSSGNINNINIFNKNEISYNNGTIRNDGSFYENTITNNINSIINGQQGTLNNNIIDNNYSIINNNKQMQSNEISKCTHEFLNEEIFNDNKIEELSEEIKNSGTFIKNIILFIYAKVINSGNLESNTITKISNDIMNSGQFISNTIEDTGYIENGGIFENNKIGHSESIIINYEEGSFKENDIDNIYAEIKNFNFLYDNAIDKISGSFENKGTICDNIISNIVGCNLENSEITIKENIIETISQNLNIEANITLNTIGYLENNTIKKEIYNNTISNLTRVNINSEIKNNTINSIIDSHIYGLVESNTIEGVISGCNLGVENSELSGFLNNTIYGDLYNCSILNFDNNIVHKNLNTLIAEGKVDFCVFHKNVTRLWLKDIYYCDFNYVEDLNLQLLNYDDNTYYPIYYTTFHGRINNPPKMPENYEWQLLADPSKKKDAYPNIKIVYVPDIVQKGMILMWYGGEDIPKGWAICDGNNGTPNLVDKFIKGASMFILDGDGGNESIMISSNNLPEHSHTYQAHSHDINGNILVLCDNAEFSTSGGVSISSSSDTLTTTGEGEVTTTVITEISTSGGETSTNSHSHNIQVISDNLSISNTSILEEYKAWENSPITIDPKHFKLVFIMKID